MKYAFGVDVGGTTVKLGFFTQEGVLMEKWEIPTKPENGGTAILPDIARSIDDCLARRGVEKADVVGVGIGGTFEKCAQMAKHALTRDLRETPKIAWVRDLEEEMLKKINNLGTGPAGLGGRITALAVNVETYPTHIAGLPMAVNICCHVNRHAHRVI